MLLTLLVPAALAVPPRGKTEDLQFEEIVLGELHACARTRAGQVSCWGRNDRGQLGDGTFKDSYYPRVVPGLDGVSSLAAGAYHTCAVLADRSVTCWGDNQSGQLGAGSLSVYALPTPVRDLGAVLSVALGDTHTCAVTTDLNVSCWGNNLYGQLGVQGLRTSPRPAPVPGLPAVRGIAAGYGHTCAMPDEGAPICWGDPSKGQLGRMAETTDPQLPMRIEGEVPALRAIAARGDQTCVLHALGVICWGPKPIDEGPKPGIEAVAEAKGLLTLSMGWGHGCALGGNKEAVCWGDDRLGQLGTRIPDTAVVKGAYGLHDVRSVAAGNGETCAARGDAGRTVCWGSYTQEEQAAAAKEEVWQEPSLKPPRYQLPPGTELLVSVDEVLTNEGARPRVVVQTAQINPCANARLDNVVTLEKRKVTLRLGDPFLPGGDCIASPGPASAWAELPADEIARRDIVLKWGKREDFYQLYVRMDRLEVIPLQETFSLWEGEKSLARVPPGSMAITCIDHREAPVCERRSRDGLPTCQDLLAHPKVREAPQLGKGLYANAWFMADPQATRISPDENYDAYQDLFQRGWRDASGCTDVRVRTWRGETWTNSAP